MLSPYPHSPRRYGFFTLLLSFFITVMVGNATAQASVNIANAPLSITISVDPNVMFIIDDSGSMQWETMPDELTNMFNQSCCANYMMWVYPRVNGLHGDSDYNNGLRVPSFVSTSIMGRAFRSHQINTMYYNPAVTYRPWSNADGSDMPPAPPAAAPNRPLFPGFGTRNLTANNTQSARWVDNRANSHTTETRIFYPAVYSTYNGPPITDLASAIADTSSPIWTIGNYSLTEIRNTTPTYTGEGRENRSDCTNSGATPPSCTYAEEIQNFANWYTYHRNRIFTARAGIGHAFVDFGSEMRVGYGRINTNTNTVDNISGRTVVRGVRAFEGAAKDAFFSNLYNDPIPPQGTPLRRALDGAGQYFSRTDARGPWSSTPGQTGGTDLACRQSYTILMTDGYWNDAEASTSGARANNDGTAGPTITGPGGQSYTYSNVSPFTDTRNNTLADVAMYYWKRDLRPDIENRVPTSAINPAFWQHMVTFGVGLGVFGTIDPDDAFDAIHSGDEITWPAPSTSGTTENIDDLLHAAVNSRGGFFSAADPQTFATELAAVLEEIVGRASSSSASAAASSSVLQGDTLLYTAGFRSEDWSGAFTARRIYPNGTVSNTSCAECWDAETKLATRTTPRNIFTRAVGTLGSGSGGGVSIHQWSNLHANQQAALNHKPDNSLDALGEARLNWLRGTEHSSLRSRSETGSKRLLGDIIHSDPQYHNGVLYVGANDGMLHAFNATSGEEMFAYIPSELLLPEPARNHAPLSRLMSPDYTHRYFMDGTPAIAEVTLSGAAKTVLVSGMGAGGRSLFALDISTPGSFAASNVLWEFRDPDLGYRSGTPAVVRMNDGTWAVVTGNGYNSDSSKAFLFVINLATGALIKKIPTNDATNNGLATPFVTDWPERNLRAQRIYAGDLFGNLWAFDVSGNTNQWDNQNRRRILFTAKDPSGDPQPITSRPYGARTSDSKAMIVVGTGSYFRTSDANDNQVQSLYGIVDHASVPNNPPTVVRTDLLEQEIIYQGTVDDKTLRVVSDDTIEDEETHKGWFIDLNWEVGERVISGPRTLGREEQRVRFSTIIPDEDPCGTGLRGFLMDIGLLSGGRSEKPVFDLDKDGYFDEDDMLTITVDGETITVPPSGLELGSGGGAPLVIDVRDETTEDTQLICDGQGNCEIGRPGDDRNPGRQSWQQLR